MQELKNIQERYEKMKVALSLTSTVSATRRDIVKLMLDHAQGSEQGQLSKNVSCGQFLNCITVVNFLCCFFFHSEVFWQLLLLLLLALHFSYKIAHHHYSLNNYLML